MRNRKVISVVIGLILCISALAQTQWYCMDNGSCGTDSPPSFTGMGNCTQVVCPEGYVCQVENPGSANCDQSAYWGSCDTYTCPATAPAPPPTYNPCLGPWSKTNSKPQVCEKCNAY
jgi:hypothetical protein